MENLTFQRMGDDMGQRLELMVESELMDAFDDLSREQGTSVALLIHMALKEFVWNMEDELEMCRVKQGLVHPAVMSAAGA